METGDLSGVYPPQLQPPTKNEPLWVMDGWMDTYMVFFFLELEKQ